MVINEEQIMSIRVDQNNGAYFKAFVGQHFGKIGVTIAEIYQDYNELTLFDNVVFKIKVVNTTDTPFIWKEFINSSNVEITYRQPDMTDQEQMEILMNE